MTERSGRLGACSFKHALRRAIVAIPVAGIWLAVVLPTAGAPAATAQSADEEVADSLSIEDCAALAYQRAPAVLIATRTWQGASADSLAASRNRTPNLSVFGHVSVSPSGSYDPTLTNLGEYMLKAGVELPLFDAGDRRRERALATDRAQLASVDLDRVRHEMRLQAASLAISILKLREQEASQDRALRWLDRLTSLLQADTRSGSRSMAEALRAQLERDAVQVTLETTRTDLAEAERALAQLLGLHSRPAPGIREPARDSDIPPASSDSTALLSSAERSPEVRTAVVNERDRAIALEEAQRRNALRVDGSADAGLAGADLTHLVPPDLKASDPDADLAGRLRRDLGASATVDFRRPFADPRVAPTIEARRRDLEAARLAMEDETETQRRERRDLLDRWESAGRKLIVAERSASQADDQVLRMRSLYSAGTSSLLELLDARRVLDDALDRLFAARAEIRLARFEAEVRR